MNKPILLILLSCLLAIGLHAENKSKKPTIFLIGDSTVKNGQGDGQGGLWGWGDALSQFVDTSRLNVENHAMGGTSSRSYRSKGLWSKVLPSIKPGDYVFIQFGHNDSGAVNDTIRARGTLKGTENKSVEIDNLLTGKHEFVHSYGWYLQQYVKEIKAKGAIPVIISPIPRNDWKNGSIIRNNQNYGLWAKKIARSEHVTFIDLNAKMASALDKIGQDAVMNTYFFKRDHTHTTAKGAVLAASMVVEGIQEEIKPLKPLMLKEPNIHFPVKKRIFLIGDSTVANGNDSIVGWGRELPAFFDSSRIEIINKARGGRSSRSYYYEGLWDEVLQQLKKGDYVLIQFGHNDTGNIDKAKFRGSLPGIGDEVQEITRPDDTHETVHTYGWYMKKYITDAKAKGCQVFVLSHIPRNRWPNDRVERVNTSFGLWSKQVAAETEVHFIDLNNSIADQYESMGQEQVAEFFVNDRTHTKVTGATYNAKTLAKFILAEKGSTLRNYVDRDALK
ncbi:MAG: rhamnogalacturonan acetylesterase [Prolixibacteraceae bacterium]